MSRRLELAGGTMWRALAVAPALSLCLIAAAPAFAQGGAQGGVKPKAASKPAPPPEPDDANEVSELVVTATPQTYQAQPGAVVGDIVPEIQLGPAEIQSYGVSNLSELLDELAPQTSSSRGRGGETPVVLLNGKRISGFNEVRDIPAEAILRVDILPEEVALKYGFTADQRVVNFVLRRRFRSLTNEVIGGGPTAGGQVNGALEGDRFAVRDDNRLNIDLKVWGNTDLTAASRGLNSQASGLPYALAGNIGAATGRGQIDPALSALAGMPVTVAGVPASAAARAPTLADFAATAGTASTDNLGRYRDLSSANQNFSANVVAARAFPAGFSGTINASLQTGASQSLQGLPNLSLLVPAGSPYSPFASDVRLYRYLDALGPLQQNTSNWSGHLGLTVNKQAGSWRVSVTGAYDHSDTLIETGAGVSAAPLQALLTSGSSTFNPYGPLSASALTRAPNSEARSMSDTANVQAVVNGPLLKVPAGQLNAAFKVGDNLSGFTAASQRFGVVQTVGLSRNDFNAQVNLDLPLASKRNNFLPAVGELSVNMNTSVNQISDFGTLKSLGYGLNWQPIPAVRFIVSHTRDEAAPSVSQLGSPTVLTPGVRLFDFATGQTVDVTQISGPNPNLTGDGRNVFKVGLTLKPWSKQRFTISANYIDQRLDNPISTFPAATAQIEAAFPDRFIRDAAGDLIEVDQRPVNFAWTARRNIRWGLNYSRPVGKPAPRPQRPPPPPAADGKPPAADQAQGRGQPQGQGQGRQARGGGQPRGPGGGGGGGFRGGGGGGGAAPGQFQIAVYHTMYFADQTLVRPGGPLLDLLSGSPSGKNGGQPINALDGQLGYTMNGLGARISATWVEGTTIQGGGGALSPTGNLTFSDLTTIQLRLFANFGQIPKLTRGHPFLRGARLTIGVYNVFDQRLKVRDGLGATPLGYQAAYLDPTGRSFNVSFRKLFF